LPAKKLWRVFPWLTNTNFIAKLKHTFIMGN
jgi:hypothetical protein